MHWYLRPGNVVAIARETSYLFVVPGREPHIIDDVDVETLSHVLAVAAQPISHDTLSAVSSEQAIEILVELGVLERGTEQTLAGRGPIRAAVSTKRCRHVTIALTGAVGVAGALEHVTAIADTFAEHVDVVLSAGAREFVQPRLYEFYGFRTWCDPFAPAHGAAVPHEHLAMTTDLVLVAPASASTLHRLASGACSDLTSLIVAATRAPVVVVPSMNPQMWRSPAVARNVAQLREDGVWVVEPVLGFLVAQRDQGGVGAGNFDLRGLLLGLDAILTAHAADR